MTRELGAPICDDCGEVDCQCVGLCDVCLLLITPGDCAPCMTRANRFCVPRYRDGQPVRWIRAFLDPEWSGCGQVPSGDE